MCQAKRILLPHWIAHNGKQAQEFQEYAVRAGEIAHKLV